MVTKYNIILLVYESSVHEKNPGPKEDVGHIATMPLVLRKMYQVRDVYSRGITYMIICNAMCSI